MLEGIEYLIDKDKLIAETDECEILYVGDSIVEHCYENNGKIYILYALDYILQTFIDSEFVWRIQGTIKSQLSIPDKKTADWSIVRRRQKRLYEKYKVLVRFEKIDYAFIEAEIIERLTIKIY